MGSVSICRPTAIQVLFTRRDFAISNSFDSQARVVRLSEVQGEKPIASDQPHLPGAV
jgi:hypothetical protein